MTRTRTPATATSIRPVVVGVDGSPAALRAVTFAAGEAHRLGLPLELIHFTPGCPSTGPRMPIAPDTTARSRGDTFLDEAVDAVRRIAPGLETRTRMFPSMPVAGLVESSENAALLVLGTGHESVADRMRTGDIVAGVAAQSAAPVVIVPPAAPVTSGPVVVGVKWPDQCTELLAAGLELAHALGTGLVAIHAWKLAPGYDDVVANQSASIEWGRSRTGLIEPVIERLPRAWPEVPVRIEGRHEQPAHALVEASSGASRLLITRPRHGGALHHLGAVGRAVLQQAQCPVEVLPPIHPGSAAETSASEAVGLSEPARA